MSPAPVNANQRVKQIASKNCNNPINLKPGIAYLITSVSFVKIGIIFWEKNANSIPTVPIIIKEPLRLSFIAVSALSGLSSPKYFPTNVAQA